MDLRCQGQIVIIRQNQKGQQRKTSRSRLRKQDHFSLKFGYKNKRKFNCEKQNNTSTVLFENMKPGRIERPANKVNQFSKAEVQGNPPESCFSKIQARRVFYPEKKKKKPNIEEKGESHNRMSDGQVAETKQRIVGKDYPL